jgi:hypothetical protein
VTGSEFPVQEWLKQVGALYGETVVGQRLACYWEEFDFFYPGIVHGFNRKSGSHLIVYDDGDKVRRVRDDLSFETASLASNSQSWILISNLGSELATLGSD